MILSIVLVFGTSLHQVMPPIWNLRKFSLFHCHAGPRHRNHRFWSIKTTHDTFTVSIWEHSMSQSRSFFRMKSENQNFVYMTWIWLEKIIIIIGINLWCKNKFTNVVLSLYWQLSKLTVWHFWSAYFDQHLPLQLSIVKWRKQICTPNNSIWINKH